jgi:branched-chain amino acid transport system permease protein
MPFVVGLCDPIRVLARGAVISEGTPQQIQKDPLVLDAYLGDDYLLEAPSKATTKSGLANVPVVERNPA